MKRDKLPSITPHQPKVSHNAPLGVNGKTQEYLGLSSGDIDFLTRGAASARIFSRRFGSW
jgi:hypothetical protein